MPSYIPPVSAAATSEIEPSRMVFPVSDLVNIPYFDPQPPNLIDMTEPFTSNSGQFTLYTEGTLGAFSVGSGTATITNTGTENTIVAENTSSYIMPQAFVSIEVSATPTESTGYDNGGIGIVLNSNNYIWGSIDRANSIGRIQIKIAGTSTFLASVTKTWVAPFSIALSLVGSSAVLWANTGSGWTVVTSANISAYYNFGTTGNLTGWNAGFTLASQNSSEWQFQNFKSGRFGGVSMRDMEVVADQYGIPYITGTSALFTATLNDPTGSQSTFGVISVDLVNHTITQEAAIAVSRSGATFMDHAGQIINYDNGDQALLITTWGNGFGGIIEVLYELFTSGNLLSGTHVVSGMTQLTLPGQLTGYGAYDPFAMFDGTTWWLAYTITQNTSFTGNPMYAALATSTDFSTWTLIGADSANMGYEGTRLVHSNNKFWVLAGGPAGTGNTARIYNQSMVFISDLDATFNTGTAPPPHPMVFPYLNDFILFTFNGTLYNGAALTNGQPNLQKAARYW